MLPPQGQIRQALVHFDRGQALLTAERFDLAVRELSAAVRLFPLLTDAHYALGQAYMALERYTSAAYAFQRTLDAAEALHGLQLKFRQGARREAERVPLQFETPAAVLLALGSAHFRSGDRAAAEHDWTRAVSLDDRLGEAWNNLAVVYMSSGRKAQAEAAVLNAERAGFRVNPRLKEEIRTLP